MGYSEPLSSAVGDGKAAALNSLFSHPGAKGALAQSSNFPGSLFEICNYGKEEPGPLWEQWVQFTHTFITCGVLSNHTVWNMFAKSPVNDSLVCFLKELGKWTRTQAGQGAWFLSHPTWEEPVHWALPFLSAGGLRTVQNSLTWSLQNLTSPF